MPRLELLSVDEAMLKSATGKRAQVLKEYLRYIDELGEGQAGKLEPGEGESVAMVRRRLGAAAKVSGKDVTIKRTGDEVYYWVQNAPRRRGRRGRSGQPQS